MANNKDDDSRLKNRRQLKNLANSIQDMSNDIYKDTYYMPTTSDTDLNSIRDGITKSLDIITQKNLDTNGMPNISNVYSRIMSSNNKNNIISNDDMNTLGSIFEDRQLIDTVASTYSSNMYIKQFDSEIDLICKYMPKLEEAIEVKKDMVLCADQFDRDFLTIRDKSSITDNSFFNSEIDIIKEKYNIAEILETSVYRAWKYGEDFLYIVPYKKAFEKILNRRKRESDLGNGSKLIKESVNINIDNKNKESSSKDSSDTFNFTVTFNMDNALTESIENMYRASEQIGNICEGSINEVTSMSFSNKIIEEAEKSNIKISNGTLNRIHTKSIIPDNTVPEDNPRDYKYNTAQDAISDVNKNDDEPITKIPGCLIKRLERDKVIPIYIEDMCMGYYYIEIQNEQNLDFSNTTQSNYGLNTSSLDMLQRYQQKPYGNLGVNNNDKTDPIKNDIVLKQAASKIASMIDAKFINTNQDLAREIYMILKYDEKFNRNTNNITVTFIPPDDIEHIYFNINKDTHRGISLLEKAMIPAKIFISISMCNAIGILTRGQDKRVYYVKQQVETNISKTLLSAINQIKKGNFGVRNLENLMGTLNITGMYNDYFIPRSSNGDSPIDFEVLQGQEINTNMDFLEKFEDYAIGTTGVPLELITSRLSVDYATQLTMTNTKHMRIVYKDQSKVQCFGSKIITKIYNAEFNKVSQLELRLPPPLYITLTNSSQLVTNVMDYAQKIMEPELKKLGVADDLISSASAEYARKVLGTYMNFDDIDEIIKKAVLESKANEQTNSDNQ